jgi:hypothetical protein
VALPSEAGISGLQGSSLKVVKNLGNFMSGEAIFERLQSNPPIPPEIPSTLGHLGQAGLQALSEVRSQLFN